MVSENYQKLANSTAAFAAAAAAASGASSADAADLVRKTPAASPAPWQNAVSWEGWYVGGSLGASWLKSDPSS
ncbi:MAG: hypothetical protein ACXWJZ_14705, partial [Burkholderiaceae bacterium]